MSPRPSKRRQLIAGDSLVAGEGAVENKGWAQQVARIIDADTCGFPGASSREFMNLLPKHPYDRVVVQIGTNDARFRHTKNATETSPEEFHENLQGIVRHFRRASETVEIIFVDLLYVEEKKTVLYRPDRSYFQRDICKAAAVLSRFCSAYGHHMVPLNEAVKTAGRLTDGLRPSQELHDEMAKCVIKHLSKCDM